MDAQGPENHLCIVQNYQTMKRSILLLAFVFGGILNARSQTISYTMKSNNPESYHPRLSLNVNLFALETSFSTIEATSFYSAIWGHFMLHDRLGIQGNFQRSWLTLAKLGNKNMPTASEYQAGAMLFLTKRIRQRKEKVILKSKESTYNNRRVTTTTFIEVPANVVKYFGFRGGLYYKNTAFNVEKDATLDAEGLSLASLQCSGLYAGIISRRLTHVVIDVPEYGGKRFKSIGFDFYMDGMLQFQNKFILRDDPFAVSTIGLKNGDDITDQIKKSYGTNLMGFRIGMSAFQIAPKSETNKKFGMSYNFEAGLMPYHGYYVKGGIGITLFKKPL
jgi:hypothetical protein